MNNNNEFVIAIDARKTELFFSITGAIAIYIALNILTMALAEDSLIRTVLVPLGGTPTAFIQTLCYMLAIYTFLGLRQRKIELNEYISNLAARRFPEPLLALETANKTIIGSRIQNFQKIMEAKLERVRFTLSGLQLLGLIGTCYGLIQAMSKSGGMIQGTFMEKQSALDAVINNFAFAFGTTLLAIILTFILSYFYHKVLAKMDTFFAELEDFSLTVK